MNFFENNKEFTFSAIFLVIILLIVFFASQEMKECRQKGGVLIEGKCLAIKEIK